LNSTCFASPKPTAHTLHAHVNFSQHSVCCRHGGELRRWKFIIIFFTTYVLQFVTFALIFLAFSNDCIVGIDGSFAHALWMSSRTASTLGFNQIYPEVTCVGPNLIVMIQVRAS
jgi:hypothetical protein